MYNQNGIVTNGQQIKNKLSVGLMFFFSIFLFIGLGVILLGIREGIDSIAYKSQGVVTKGQVIEIIRKRSDDGYTYSPLVEFPVLGKKYQFENSISSSSSSYQEGEEVDVIYMPDNPRKARINSFFGFWGATIFMSIFGGIFALVGGGMIYGTISTILHARK